MRTWETLARIHTLMLYFYLEYISVRIKYIFGVFTIQWHTHNMVLKKKVLTNKMVPMEYAYLRRGLTLLGNAVILAHYIKLHCKYGVITYLPCQIWEGDLGRCGGNEACSSLFFWFTYILALFFLTAEYSCSCKDLATHVHSLWKWHIYGLFYAVFPQFSYFCSFETLLFSNVFFFAPKTKCDFFQWFSDSVWYTLLLMIACYLAEKHNKKLFAVSQQLGEKSTVVACGKIAMTKHFSVWHCSSEACTQNDKARRPQIERSKVKEAK